MFALLAPVLAKLAVEVLDYIVKRQDIKNVARAEIQKVVYERLVKANHWASSHPDPGGLLDRGGHVSLDPPRPHEEALPSEVLAGHGDTDRVLMRPPL